MAIGQRAAPPNGSQCDLLIGYFVNDDAIVVAISAPGWLLAAFDPISVELQGENDQHYQFDMHVMQL